MRQSIGALVLTLAVAAAACASPPAGDPATGGATTTAASGVPPAASGTAGMMAAAIGRLIGRDHTFGEGPPPFDRYLIRDHVDPDAGDSQGDAPRPLTEEEQAAIDDVVAPFGPVQWIDDPAEWRTDDLRPVVEGSVILGVGEPTIDGDTGLVPVSLWCGGTCGTWLVYRLELVDGAWTVTGTEGPIAVS